jgi:prepilin-type N-terminal cleavage/methylation domain-containing protein
MARRFDTRHPGFTLTELLIVVLIIAVLIGVLLPAIGGARATARKSSSLSFMNEILGASAQFQAAERRLPGYFAVRDLASVDNFAKGPADKTTGGFTQMESALIDLAGGVDSDQSTEPPSANYNPATEQAPDRIRVSPGGTSAARSVIIKRSAIGAGDGPGYLGLPDQFVDPGSRTSGQVGSPAGRLMPDLLDAFGMPILMWQRDPLAAAGGEVITAVDAGGGTRFPTGTGDPHFYLNTNCGMLHAERLGRGAERSQYNNSTLSWSLPGAETTNSPSQAIRTLSAIVGHPAFPSASSMSNLGENGPIPAQPRGDIVMHSAGADGIFAKKRLDVITRIQYVPEGYQFKSGDDGWLQAGERLEKYDDIILPGG